MTFQPIELGDRAKDPITGFSGIVTAITTWLHGCIRITIEPEKLDKDGKPQEGRSFDQTQVVLVKKGIHKPMVLGITPPPAPETRPSRGGPAREGSTFRR